MTIIGLESQEQEKNVVEEYNRTAYKWKWVITTNSDSGGIKTLLRVSKPTKITNLGITQEDDQAGTGFFRSIREYGGNKVRLWKRIQYANLL